MIKLSQRLSGLEESVTLAITAKARSLVAEGRDIIGLGAGEPDFDTPENIKAAAIRAIGEGHTKYTPVGGINELKDAVAAKFRRDNALEYSREEIIVSCGGKHSIFNLFQAILDPGDEVIIPAPYWVSYPVMVKLAGGLPRVVRTTEGSGFKMSADAFMEHVTRRTKAVVINSPSNPTGAAYSEDELKAIALAAIERGVLIISDEIYEKLAYGGFRQVSIASISEDARRGSVVLNGVSKSYAMTGWRIGYAAGPREIVKAMTNVQSQSTSNPASISQWAAVEALNGPQGFIADMVREFARRRDAMVDGLRAIPGVSCFKPQGAFYAFADVSRFYGRRAKGAPIDGSAAMAAYLLEDAGVAVVPGEPFGDDAHVRLSYATSIEHVREGVRRMGEALLKLA